MNEFLINWKLKSFIYKILFFFKAHNILFFIQKKITKRANIEIFTIDNSWKYHLKNLQYFRIWCRKIFRTKYFFKLQF